MCQTSDLILKEDELKLTPSGRVRFRSFAFLSEERAPEAPSRASWAAAVSPLSWGAYSCLLAGAPESRHAQAPVDMGSASLFLTASPALHREQNSSLFLGQR